MEQGEDMGQHGEGIDGEEIDAPLDDGQEIDADEQADISDAAFTRAGIAPIPDWSTITQRALDRALTLEVPPPVDLTTIAVSPRVFGLPRARMPRGVHSSPVLLRGRFAR